jgi:hypothetical protein
MNHQIPQLPNDGDINWGTLIKSAFSTITGWINQKASLLHIHTIECVSNLRQALDSKADLNHEHHIDNITELQQIFDGIVNHEHPDIIYDIDELKSIVNVMLPNLTLVTFTMSISTCWDGFNVRCLTIPTVHVPNWDVIIYRPATPRNLTQAEINTEASDWAIPMNEVFKGTYTSPSFYIHRSELLSGSAIINDQLIICVRARSGNTFGSHLRSSFVFRTLRDNEIIKDDNDSSGSFYSIGDIIEMVITNDEFMNTIMQNMISSPTKLMAITEAITENEDALELIAEKISTREPNNNLNPQWP